MAKKKEGVTEPVKKLVEKFDLEIKDPEKKVKKEVEPVVLSIYPTLLDSFFWYKKMGDQKLQELLDKINRVQPSEFPLAALKGIQFEDCVNRLLKKQPLDLHGEFYKTPDFEFNTDIVDKIANKLSRAEKQQEYIEAIIPTEIGNIKVYGFVDYSYPNMLVDLKTTGKYSIGKFQNNNQHKAYSLVKKTNGTPIDKFNYLVTDFKNIFVETYETNDQHHNEFLQEVYEFWDFLQFYKSDITDKKIFGGKN